MYSDSFRSSDAASRIRSISRDSGIHTVTRDVFFSAMSRCLPTHKAFVKTNKGITKHPVRRLSITAQKAGDVTLTRSNFIGDFALSKPKVDKVLNKGFPVHGAIITHVIDKGKHHRDRLNTDNHDMDTLAKRLTAKREALGLSQSELAKKAKLKGQSIIGMLESGARKSSSHIPAIANALGVESLWLSSGTGPETRGGARTYELSEVAMKVALLVNDMSEEQQVALLSFLTTERSRIEDKESVKKLTQGDL